MKLWTCWFSYYLWIVVFHEMKVKEVVLVFLPAEQRVQPAGQRRRQAGLEIISWRGNESEE